MNKHPSILHSGVFTLALFLSLAGGRLDAGSATWNLNPVSGIWNDPTNWTPAAEPNSFADTATFGLSNTTSITLSAGTRLDGIVFNAGASAFTIATTNALPISPALTLSGAGITNSSGIIQNFMTAGGGANNGGPSQIFFRNSATAGSMTNYTSSGGIESTGFGGGIFFYNTSTAGSGTFLIKGSAVAGADGGFAVFNNTSSAGNGVFTNNGAVVGGIGAGGTGAGGLTEFDNTASAANGTFINNGGTVFDASGGRTHFFDTSTAGNGTFTSKGAAVVGAFGGVTGFLDGSNAGTGHFTTDGGAVGGARGAFASFNDTASAASGTFTTNGGAGLGALGGETDFFQTSTAGNATLIANAGTGGGNGGSIGFFSSSTGGTATVKVFGNGKLDISTHTAPGVTVGSIEGTGKLFLGSRLLTVGSNDLSTIFSGVIQNGGSFTKIGTGALTLSGVNTYTGATAVNAGALIVNGALNVASAVSVESGATLGGSGAVNGAVTVKDGGILAPGAAGSPGTFTLGSLALNPTSNLNFRLGAPNVVGGASNDLISVTGVLTLDGILNVTDSGAFGTGTYRLINYGGALMDQGLGIGVVPAGFNAGDFTIQISVANQVNLVVGTTALFWDGAQTVANGVVNGGSGDWNTTMTNWTTASGATNSAWNNQFAVFSGVAGGAVTLKESVSTTGMQFATAGYTIGADPGQSITLNGATIFRVDAGLAATINAPLTGAGSLTKTDTGALTLGGANTYAGLTTVTAGTLKLGTANAIKSGNALTTAAAGIFDLNGNAQTLGLLTNGGNVTNSGASATLTIGNDSLGAGSFTGAMNVIWNQGASSTTLTGSWSNVGDITLNANGAGAIGLATGIVNNIGTVTNSGLGNGSILISAAIGTSVTGVIQDSATSPLILNSANTFTGGLKIQQGTVQVGNAAGVGAGLVTLGSAGHSATLDLNGQTETILSLATAGVAANQTIGNSSTTTNAVLNYTGATTSTFGGVIQNVLGGGNKTTGVTVNNAAASLMLSGVNTYTGATTVSAGSLFVNGSLANGPVSVASGATLGGIGTLGGAVTVANGGKLAPGVGGPGTLTVGSLILNGVANLNFDLGTPGVVGGVNDLLQVTGSLTLDGNLNIANAGGFGFGSYRLINFGGALTNNGLVLGTTPAGFTGDFTVQTSVAGQVNLIVSPASGILFWDGSQLVANGVVNGGSGIWDNSRTNWTNAAGTAQSAWAGGMAVFTGAAGTVSLSENVATTGMQFSTTGYAINSLGGKTIALTGAAALRVDSGKAATINAPLTGGGSLTKTDTGTLILTGNNSYTGGTTVVSGFLTVRNAAGLGLGSGPVTVLASLGSNLIFDTNSSAGSATITNKGSGSNNLGVTSFIDTSTAGSATIINEGNTATGGSGGLTFFRITSRAGAATINNLGAGFSVLSGTGSGGLQFIESSTADSATITNFAGLGNGLFGGGAEFAGGGIRRHGDDHESRRRGRGRSRRNDPVHQQRDRQRCDADRRGRHERRTRRDDRFQQHEQRRHGARHFQSRRHRQRLPRHQRIDRWRHDARLDRRRGEDFPWCERASRRHQ